MQKKKKHSMIIRFNSIMIFILLFSQLFTANVHSGQSLSLKDLILKKEMLKLVEYRIKGIKNKKKQKEQVEQLSIKCKKHIIDRFNIECSSYKNYEDGKKDASLFIRKNLNYLFDNFIANILKGFKSQDKNVEEGLIKVINKKYSNEKKEFCDAFLNQNFENIYQTARKNAVLLQFNKSIRIKYPLQQEVNELDLQNWDENSVDLLKQKIQNNSTKKKCLFDENELRLEQEVNIIIEKIFNQYNEQKKIIYDDNKTNTIKQDAIIQKLIALELKNYVNNLLAKLKNSNSQKLEIIYDIFPSIINIDIKNKALEIERIRFERYAEKYPIQQKDKVIENIIYQDISKHINYNDSFYYIVDELLPSVKKNIIETYSNKIVLYKKITEKEIGLFKERLNNYLVSDKIDKLIKNKLMNTIEESLHEVRETIVKDQMRKYFYPIISFKYIVVEEKLNHFDNTNFIINEYKDIYKLKNVTSNPEKVNKYLIDSGRKEILKLTKIIYEQGKRAFDTQFSIASRITNDLSYLKKNIFDRNSDEWIKYYIAKVYENWKKIRKQVIWQNQENYILKKYDTFDTNESSDSYLKIFNYTQDFIKQRIIITYNEHKKHIILNFLNKYQDEIKKDLIQNHYNKNLDDWISIKIEPLSDKPYLDEIKDDIIIFINQLYDELKSVSGGTDSSANTGKCSFGYSITTSSGDFGDIVNSGKGGTNNSIGLSKNFNFIFIHNEKNKTNDVKVTEDGYKRYKPSNKTQTSDNNKQIGYIQLFYLSIIIVIFLAIIIIIKRLFFKTLAQNIYKNIERININGLKIDLFEYHNKKTKHKPTINNFKKNMVTKKNLIPINQNKYDDNKNILKTKKVLNKDDNKNRYVIKTIRESSHQSPNQNIFEKKPEILTNDVNNDVNNDESKLRKNCAKKRLVKFLQIIFILLSISITILLSIFLYDDYMATTKESISDKKANTEKTMNIANDDNFSSVVSDKLRVIFGYPFTTFLIIFSIILVLTNIVFAILLYYCMNQLKPITITEFIITLFNKKIGSFVSIIVKLKAIIK